MSDGLVTMLGLFYGMAAGPSNAGNREDGKICTAQPGECRFNRRYYSPGMNDAKSWSCPSADETCPNRCPYLSEDYRDTGTEDERREQAWSLVEGVMEKKAADKAVGVLALGMMGIDPRPFLEDEDV